MRITRMHFFASNRGACLLDAMNPSDPHNGASTGHWQQDAPDYFSTRTQL